MKNSGPDKGDKLKNIIKNPAIRARVIFVLSVIGAMAFAAFNAYAGIKYLSIWYGALAIYYILLTVQKILLLILGGCARIKYGKDGSALERENLKIYITNGVYILVLDLALTASIIQMVTAGNPTQVGEVIAIATAAYAFFKIISATVNIIKIRRTSDLALLVIRYIGLIEAIVSMLALTATMIDTFGSFEEMRVLLILVAAGAGFAIAAIGAYITANGVKKLRNVQQ